MKKALLIKLESFAYSSIAIEKAFKEHFEVRSINWQQLRFINGNNGLKVIWETILNECETFQPDLIWVHLQVDYILTTEQFKELGKRAFVINYTEDVREDISWYEQCAPSIGLTIFTNMDDVDNVRAKGIYNVAYMPVSYNHIWYRPVSKTNVDYGDIIFIGNDYTKTNLNFPFAKERQDMIEFMESKFGNRFMAYGMGQRNRILSPQECIEAYNNCKIVITQNNFKRRGYCSDRGMNALGCGAITIHQSFDDDEKMFDPMLWWLYSWRKFDDIERVCKFLLESASYMIVPHKDIADYAKQNHSWIERSVRLINLINLYDKVSLPYQPTIRKNISGNHPESELYHYKQ